MCDILCLASHLCWKRGLPPARLSPVTAKLLHCPVPTLVPVPGPHTHPYTGKEPPRPGLSKTYHLASLTQRAQEAEPLLALSVPSRCPAPLGTQGPPDRPMEEVEELPPPNYWPVVWTPGPQF